MHADFRLPPIASHPAIEGPEEKTADAKTGQARQSGPVIRNKAAGTTAWKLLLALDR